MSVFRFKQFEVAHDRCAMKVNTDGVLLGAWAAIDRSKTALDIGTGSGVIALMLAQRSANLQITGLEIESGAAKQADENFLGSPWSNRLQCMQIDFLTFQPEQQFDLIISNPPFFEQDLRSGSHERDLARHDVGMNVDQLLKHAATMLTPEGRVCLVLPIEYERKLGEWEANGWYPERKCAVFPNTEKQPNRMLISLVRNPVECLKEELTIRHPDGSFTKGYQQLTSDFYLHF